MVEKDQEAKYSLSPFLLLNQKKIKKGEGRGREKKKTEKKLLS
jgi:hypothetical protein